MQTITDLKELLKNMKPELKEGEYYIATVDESQLMILAGYIGYIVCVYREDEGLTIVFPEELKEVVEGMTNEKIAGPFAMITLNVYSDLMAVGFLAKITDSLAKKKISVNAFSAYHHDHLFVPYERRKDAIKVLERLQKI